MAPSQGAITVANDATLAANGPEISATRVPIRSSAIPPITVPMNLPIANAVTICAAPPADISNSRAITGIVGMIIAHAPDKKVPM
jgi:hypothetical protein